MTKCPKCERIDVIKYGFNYTENHKVQKYKCLSCKTLFSYSERLPETHVSSEIISLCFDLYLKGLSYRIIKQQILEQFDLNVSHVTIYNWIQEYTNLMMDYTRKLKPSLSAVWQMDETNIPFKGINPEIKKIKRSKSYWCWVCIDTGTRFVLDMYLSPGWSMDQGMIFFDRVKSSTYHEPKVICTDGNRSYVSCIKTYYPKTSHILLKSISIKPSTSFIERFNGTIKNRTKIMRCFGSFHPCQTTLNAFKIYYNFLRPHMALDGKTPAEEAGIHLNLKNRWIYLIRQAMSC